MRACSVSIDIAFIRAVRTTSERGGKGMRSPDGSHVHSPWVLYAAPGFDETVESAVDETKKFEPSEPSTVGFASTLIQEGRARGSDKKAPRPPSEMAAELSTRAKMHEISELGGSVVTGAGTIE